jgi:glycosyltransferase involved in cell wall biosynthesis
MSDAHPIEPDQDAPGPAPAGRAPARVLHVVHGWPPHAHGGTELYAHGLAHAQRAWREVAVYARSNDRGLAQGAARDWDDAGVRVRLVANHYRQRDPLARGAIADRRSARDFAQFLQEVRPDLVHLHHLAGFSFSLAAVARRAGVPIVWQVQDWWALCARITLLDAREQRCDGPALGKCVRCAPATRVPPAAVWNLALHLARRRAARRAMALAAAYVMGSRRIRDDHLRAGLFAPGIPAHVLDYGVSLPATTAPRAAAGWPVRFGFVGSARPHKGLQVLQAAFEGIDPARATLRVFGSAGERFAEHERDAVYAAMDVLLMPSLGLESFGLVAREAIARGVPVIAAADGALLELDCEHVPVGDVGAWRDAILRLIEMPARVDERRRALAPVTSTAQHAREIEAIYAEVLARCG